MVITDFLERNARLYGSEVSLVELNPSEERDSATTWWDFNLIESAGKDAPYRRELTWKDFDRRANRFANLLLSRGLKRGTKVGILLMNCIEWLPIYFGILKAGCIAVPMNFRFSGDEIEYCLDLADVEVLVFGPEFVSRMDTVHSTVKTTKVFFYLGKGGPDYTEDCLTLMGYCSSSAPPVALNEEDNAAIYFSSGTTGFPKAILHNHKALLSSCKTEQNHHSQTKDDVFLCIPPLYHTGAKMHWFGSFLEGGKAVLLKGTSPEVILRTASEEHCSIVYEISLCITDFGGWTCADDASYRQSSKGDSDADGGYTGTGIGAKPFANPFPYRWSREGRSASHTGFGKGNAVSDQ